MSNYNDVFGGNTITPAQSSYLSLTIETGVPANLAWPHRYNSEDINEYPVPTILSVVPQPSAVLRLPPGDEASVGASVLVFNAGAHTVEIQDSNNGPVTAVDAGIAKYFYLTDNSTSYGEWGMFTYGAGASGADANLLAGNGLRNNVNRLETNVPYRAFNSNISVSNADRAHLCDARAGTLDLTLPFLNSVDVGYYIFARNSSDGHIYIKPSAGESIDRQSQLSLAPGESCKIIATATDWVSVGYGRDSTFIFSETVIDAGSGDVSLTSSQVSGRMLRITGVATAPLTVTLPSVDNIYFISVESGMGVHGVEFSTGSGVVLALSANQRTVAYCDGVNVTAAITTTVTSSLSLSDGGAASPTLFYALDTDTGFYRSGPGAISFTSNGEEKLKFGPTGLESGVLAERVGFVPVDGLVETDVQGAIEALQLSTVKTFNVIAIAKGGTGATTAAGARTALLPSYNGNANKALVVNAGATDVTYAVVGDVSSAGAQDLSNKTLLTTKEKVSVSSAAAAGTVNLDAATASILYYQSAAGGNWTLNVRGNSGTTLSSLMAVGTAITVVFMNTNGGTAYRLTSLQVDSVTITPRWQGGTAPTTGNANSIDAYVITIIKTSESAFTALASLTRFA